MQAARQEPPRLTERAPPAPRLRAQVLTKRADFVRASSALRAPTPGFTLQARPRPVGEAEGLRVGFTCSRKVGNAVARNRAKRRLREVARAVLPREGRDGWDYVLIGRPETTTTLPFLQLLSDLSAALSRVHAKASAGPPPL